jgi:hypothetical protein
MKNCSNDAVADLCLFLGPAGAKVRLGSTCIMWLPSARGSGRRRKTRARKKYLLGGQAIESLFFLSSIKKS